MPYINIRVAGELSADQKAEIVKQVTQTMLDVANKPKEATYITIDEVSRSNWAKGGELLQP